MLTLARPESPSGQAPASQVQHAPTLDHHRSPRTSSVPTYPWASTGPTEDHHKWHPAPVHTSRRPAMPMAQVDSCCRRFSPCQGPLYPSAHGGHGPWWPSAVAGRAPVAPQDLHYYRRSRANHYVNRYTGEFGGVYVGGGFMVS